MAISNQTVDEIAAARDCSSPNSLIAGPGDVVADQPPPCTLPKDKDAKVDTDTKPTEKSNANVVSDNDDDYVTSSWTSCPPLVQLQTYGFCCPFIESEEEHDARIAVSHLQHYPITYYRKKLVEDIARDVQAAAPTAASGFIGKMGKMLGATGTKQSIPMTYHGVPATFSIVDTESHGPVIEIRTLEMNDTNNSAVGGGVNDAVANYMTSGKPWWEDANLLEKKPCKTLPIYMIDKIGSGWSISNDSTAGGIKLYGAPPPSKGFLEGLNNAVSPNGPELLRFDTLGGSGTTWRDDATPDEPNKYSDKIIVQLKSLVDWNRRRMARGIKNGSMTVAPRSDSPGLVTIT
eukprot:CAMPEP_0183708446 /NCGR_PEP_ID=MMETSP0737-20130205/4779_1 /TAXON_ID=385413 /ORGANISM="Thalassiosira miniscula, Strain CCMP1093" /LENGTH=346 /DNA_ID=CAMNT_0025936339 /DNA_START=43 /DNA_END=1083 /DNA_ORIENTATION=+